MLTNALFMYLSKNTVKKKKVKYCIGYLYNCFCFNILQNLIDSILLIFSIITPVFSLTWSFSYSNISYYYQSWKRFSAVSFKTKIGNHGYFFRIFWWIGSSKEQHLFETGIFCNITKRLLIYWMHPCWIKILISLREKKNWPQTNSFVCSPDGAFWDSLQIKHWDYDIKKL